MKMTKLTDPRLVVIFFFYGVPVSTQRHQNRTNVKGDKHADQLSDFEALATTAGTYDLADAM